MSEMDMNKLEEIADDFRRKMENLNERKQKLKSEERAYCDKKNRRLNELLKDEVGSEFKDEYGSRSVFLKEEFQWHIDWCGEVTIKVFGPRKLKSGLVGKDRGSGVYKSFKKHKDD